MGVSEVTPLLVRRLLTIAALLLLPAACLVPDVDWSRYEVACDRSRDCPHTQRCVESTCVPGGSGGGADAGGSDPDTGQPAPDCTRCRDDDGCDEDQVCAKYSGERYGHCRAICRDDAGCGDGGRCVVIGAGVSACLPVVGRADGTWSCTVSAPEPGPQHCEEEATVEYGGRRFPFSRHFVTSPESGETLWTHYDLARDEREWALTTFLPTQTLAERVYRVPDDGAFLRFGFVVNRNLQALAVGSGGTVTVREAGKAVGELSAGVFASDLVRLAAPEALCEADSSRCADGRELLCGPCGLSEQEGGPCGS